MPSQKRQSPTNRKGHDFTEKLLKNLVSIPSINPEMDLSSSGESEISAFLADKLRDLGTRVELQRVLDSSGRELKRQNVIAHVRLRSRRRSTSSRTLMLNGHVDTVPVKGMSIPPFKPRVVEGKLFGRGSSDMKGGITAAISAARSLLASGRDLGGDLMLTFVAGEELHSPGIEALTSKYKADAAIVGEPTDMKLGLALKGFTHLEVEIFGKPAHGSVPELGVDAIEKMSEFVLSLRGIQEKLKQRSHPLIGYPRIHTSTIQGGITWNVIPDYCKLHIESRTIPGESSTWAEEELVDSLEKIASEGSKIDFHSKVTKVFERLPMETGEDEEIVRSVGQTFTKLEGGQPEIIGLPYWCDAGHLSRVGGIPSVILGPGRVQEAHTSDEFVQISQVHFASEIYRETAENFLKG